MWLAYDHDWNVLTTSDRRSRIPRLLDMVGTVWRERQNYDVAQVDLYSGLAFIWAEAVCSALRLAGKPFIVTLRGGDLPAFSRRWPARARRLLNSADIVTAPSGYLAEEMRAFRRDIVLLPNPVDVASYRYRLRREARPTLVWLRAFHSIYNPTLSLRALSLLVDELPDVSLAMIGPDKGDGTLAEVQRLASELGLSDRVTFKGWVSKGEIPSVMDGGDIFLNTASVDNTPVSVLEAMASGLCVASTNVGGIPYLLENGNDALLVAPNDPQALASAVRNIVVKPGLAEKLSQAGRTKSCEFDWKVILPRWMELMTAASDRRRRPSEA